MSAGTETLASSASGRGGDDGGGRMVDEMVATSTAVAPARETTDGDDGSGRIADTMEATSKSLVAPVQETGARELAFCGCCGQRHAGMVYARRAERGERGKGLGRCVR